MISTLILGLTFIILCSIIIRVVQKRKKYFAKTVYTQSSIHQIVKNFLPKDLFEVPKILSQSRKHVRNNTVKVLIIEDNAYWVHNNMFYVYDKETNEFMAQGSSKEEVENNLQKRYPGKRFGCAESNLSQTGFYT